jgi:hypothetical protein
MRKLRLLLLYLPLSFLAKGQAGQINLINIVSFNVKPVLPGTVDTWLNTTAAMILVAQKVPGPVPLREPRLVVQIRSGGAVICGNTMATAKAVDPFDVRTFNTADLIGMLSNCRELKEGSYSICVQFFNIDKVAISREVCKEFRVEAPKTVEYAPPTLITPEDQKKFTTAQLMGPVIFRWTPLVPKPQQPVTYRLKVWQLMQGQNGTSAMRTNQPIVTKDVDNLTQATVNTLISGPCDPPFLCDFIWNVQALTKEGKPLGNNNGNSEPYRFSATSKDNKCPVNTMPENNKQFSLAEAKQSIQFKWTNTATPGTATVYRLKVWQLLQRQSASQAMKANNPFVTKEVRNLNEVTIPSLLSGPCDPPFICDFIWAVEMLDATGRVNCTSEGTSFSVKEESQQQQCPVNLFPEDKKKFTQREAKGPVTFKWTNTAMQGTSSAYKLRVWQLMQGQNATQAMKTNNPIITRQLSNANEITINGILTGPCKPPYLCDFVWNVDMIDAAGRTLCSGEPTVYKIANNDVDIQIDSVDVECCKNGKQNIYLKLKNNLASPVKITQIKIDKVNGTTASIIPSPLAPSLPFTIPGNGSQAFTGQINCIDTAKIIRFFVAAEDPVDNAITETEVEADTLHCACDACDEKHFVMNVPAPGQINTTTNSISFNQPITIVATPPKTVKKITAELVYFEMKPENDQCIPCDKEARLYGHFTNGTNSLQWAGPQSNLNITITTPVTPCCSTVFRWCIRYKVEFSDCTVCSKVVCYEKKKSGCVPTGGGGNDDHTLNNLPK